MAKKATRKCNACGNEIKVDYKNIKDIIFYKSLYYHKDCFIKFATDKSRSKRGKPKEWQEALDNISTIEIQTKERLEHDTPKDRLNEYLIKEYDIVYVPEQFWVTVEKLNMGIYREKKCKPIKTEMLLDMWKWGQKNLNKIYANNKTKNKAPNDAFGRIRYDLAVLIRHTDDYIKFTTRSKEEAIEIADRVENARKFNYEKIYAQSKKEESSSNDILDLMNEIF